MPGKEGEEGINIGSTIEPYVKAPIVYVSVDVTAYFTTDQVFESCHVMMDWCQQKGREIKCIVITQKSDNGGKGRKPRVTLGCERGGLYRDHHKKETTAQKRKCEQKMEEKKEDEKKDTTTTKYGCPFALKGLFLGDDRWKVEVVCGNHNHHLPNTLESHPCAARLTREKRKIVKEMSLSGVKSSQIIATLRRHGSSNVSTMKTIYNCKLKLRLKDSEGRTTVQQLLHMLVEKHYVYWLRENVELNEVKDIFWAHPYSILLTKCFPAIVLIDCTYKTNRYKMPLLQIVGMTSTGCNFTVVNAFVRSEKDDNYEWVLSKLRSLFDPRAIPSVIVTDREQALMNSISVIFPDVDHLRCTLHISRNVEQHCKSVFKTKVIWKKFIDTRTTVTHSSMEEEFNSLLQSMKEDMAGFPDSIQYIEKIWLMHKERFVHAWTNKVKHFGNHTTNRAEDSHGKIKNLLKTSQVGFAAVWREFDTMFTLQLTQVRAYFERILTLVRHTHQGTLLRELRGQTSHYALDLIVEERKKIPDLGIDGSGCDHVNRMVYGLPCACELLKYGREVVSIPIKEVDDHWKKLSILPNMPTFSDLDYSSEMTLFKKLFELSTDDEKKHY